MADRGGPGDSPDRPAALSGLWQLLIGVGVLAAAVGLVLHSSDDKKSPYAHLRPADPVQISVASLHLHATVVPISVNAERVLEPPADTDEAGWWDQSTQPGRLAGQTVITGHTVHTGGGVMNRLPDVRRGASVDLKTGNGTMRYQVVRVRTLSHEELAADATSLFGQQKGGGRLVLVTCTDWNGSYYESNVVVLAKPLGRPTGAAKKKSA